MNKYSVKPLPSDVIKEIASRAVEIRKRLGWTQMELSARSGVSYGSVKRFEQTGQIALLSLLKIAEAIRRLDDFNQLFVSNNDEGLKDLFKE